MYTSIEEKLMLQKRVLCMMGITVSIYRQDFVLKRLVAIFKKLQHYDQWYQRKKIQTNYR